MNSLIRSAFLLLGAASMAPAATLINVDFNSNGGAAGTYNGSSAPVLGTTGDIWNGISVSGATPSIPATALKTVDNQTSAVTVAVTTFHTAADLTGAAQDANIDPKFQSLMIDYLYLHTSSPSQSATITLAGLPSSTLGTIVLFGANTANQGSNFTIDGITKTTTDTGSIGTTLTAGDEYVRFDNVLSSATGVVTITWARSGATAWSVFNGMQLDFVPVTVPEPSVALLGGLGVLALLRRRR